MVLEVRFRPAGVAQVEINVEPDAGGTRIDISETPTCGPLSKLPRAITNPILRMRNALSLWRLRRVVERS
jgi:hypothetical protein